MKKSHREWNSQRKSIRDSLQESGQRVPVGRLGIEQESNCRMEEHIAPRFHLVDYRFGGKRTDNRKKKH